jgi:general secretion pathway protein B
VAAAPADAPAFTASAGDGRVLSLAELDGGTRNALPPLRLSMHLWNRDPARRFVILDGQRLGEGDRIGEASIVRIERDGVLLDWHGRGIHVPVR